MKKVFCVIFLSVFILAACSKGGSDASVPNNGGMIDCSTVPKSFAADVNPIIQSNCAISGCHASGSINGPGPLTNYTLIFNARTSIRAAVLSGAMPQNSTLPVAQKNSIICWIDSGAPNN